MKIACFDIGGTFIKFGILDEEDQIIEFDSVKTPDSNCRLNIPKFIIKILNIWKKEYNIKAVGICSAGTIDREKGQIIFASEIPDYSGTNLVEIIESSTGLPCILENDVNGAALGEFYKGAAKNKENFICLTIGTGIGSAIFLNGQLYRGNNGLAGEIGHMSIDLNGKECNCGNKGCFARYGSTKALIERYEDQVYKDKKVDGKYIMEKVKNKDLKAINVFNEYIEYVAIGLANISHILNPESIIIGGGISAAGDDFFLPLIDIFERKLVPSFRGKTKIITGELGNKAALIGIGYEFKKIIKEESI